jgi:hypothetical protein
MRRGCIAIGKLGCDGCQRPIRYGERYLLISGKEDEKQRLCIDCCISRGYVSYETEKGKRMVTFLPEG